MLTVRTSIQRGSPLGTPAEILQGRKLDSHRERVFNQALKA
jgi:hypothetical protein